MNIQTAQTSLLGRNNSFGLGHWQSVFLRYVYVITCLVLYHALLSRFGVPALVHKSER